MPESKPITVMSAARGALRYAAFCALLVAVRGFGLAAATGQRYPASSFLLDTFLLCALMGVCHAVYFCFQKLVRACGIERKRYAQSLNVLFVLFAAFPFLLTGIQLHPQKLLPRQTPAAFSLPFENVELRTNDLVLRGWLINPEAKNPPIILLHGLNANKDNFLAISAEFARHDFPVLTFDFRAHGESDGRLTTFGLREKADVAAAVAWVKQRYPGKKIFAIGYSLGGAALLQYSADEFPFERIAVDATFATLEDATMDKLFPYAGPLKDPLFGLLAFWARVWSDEDFRSFDNRTAAARLDPQRVLFIHGTRDTMIAASQSEKLRAASGGKIALWKIEGAGHLETIADPAYFDKLISFFLGEAKERS